MEEIKLPLEPFSFEFRRLEEKIGGEEFLLTGKGTEANVITNEINNGLMDRATNIELNLICKFVNKERNKLVFLPVYSSILDYIWLDGFTTIDDSLTSVCLDN